MNLLTRIIIDEPVQLEKCEGFWKCISPANYLTVVMTFFAIAIPVITTIVIERGKANNEKTRRIEEERKPLSRQLLLNKHHIENILKNFESIEEKESSEDHVRFIKETNREYLGEIEKVLLDSEIIRVDEIERMRLFRGSLKSANTFLLLNHYNDKEYFKSVRDSKVCWERIKCDYKIS
ncbi:hypothetical protein [Halobacillus seohaensis]|uniref:Uncharacterized protein n=1 Tax=Halobacillus seohaensis TaxID=447421 RepID=A0ABW2EUC9_9BACI